jgi:hypothetical protein
MSNRRIFRYHLLAAVVLCVVGVTEAQAPNARAILDKMISRYKTINSYQDSGVVRRVQADPSKIARLDVEEAHHSRSEDETLVTFKTYFQRPNRFRFDWNSSMFLTRRNAVIWFNGKKAYEWMPQSITDQDFTLSSSSALWLAVVEANRSSAGATFVVPSMLTKGVDPAIGFADHLESATDLWIMREESCEDESCYVVRGHLSGTPWVFWIGKNSYLLRKFRTLYSRGSFHDQQKREQGIAEEIHSNIKINGKLSRDVFNFRPRLLPNDVDLTR